MLKFLAVVIALILSSNILYAGDSSNVMIRGHFGFSGSGISQPSDYLQTDTSYNAFPGLGLNYGIGVGYRFSFDGALYLEASFNHFINQKITCQSYTVNYDQTVFQFEKHSQLMELYVGAGIGAGVRNYSSYVSKITSQTVPEETVTGMFWNVGAGTSITPVDTRKVKIFSDVRLNKQNFDVPGQYISIKIGMEYFF